MKPTQEQVIAVAREAGIGFQENTGITRKKTAATYGSQPIERLERFYTLVRNQALEDATNLEWTGIMREGAWVTWGDAEMLGERVVEQLRNMKDKT